MQGFIKQLIAVAFDKSPEGYLPLKLHPNGHMTSQDASNNPAIVLASADLNDFNNNSKKQCDDKLV